MNEKGFFVLIEIVYNFLQKSRKLVITREPWRLKDGWIIDFCTPSGTVLCTLTCSESIKAFESYPLLRNVESELHKELGALFQFLNFKVADSTVGIELLTEKVQSIRSYKTL